jgi:hypothetical protein
MFINFTGPRVELDPSRYPEGLIVQIRSLNGNFAITHEGVTLAEKSVSSWKTADGREHSIRVYSLTEDEGVTELDELGFADFRVPSFYVPVVDGADVVRNVEVSIIRRPEGWMVELTDFRVEDSDTFSYPLDPRFNPLATITLEGPKPKEAPEEKPPGETIWERLDED